MNRMAGMVAGALFSLAISGAAFAQQVSGKVGVGAPEDVFLVLTMGANGGVTLSKSEFKLAQGGYYRFNLVCPDSGPKNEASIEFHSDGLLENSHLRLVSVSERSTGGPQGTNEINFHVQGEQIRFMECEGLPLNVRFSFYPIKKGTYPFTINNKTVQPAVETKGSFIVE
jgi:hypothetical protein